MLREFNAYIDDEHYVSTSLIDIDVFNRPESINDRVESLVDLLCKSISNEIPECTPENLKHKLQYNTGKEYKLMDIFDMKYYNLRAKNFISSIIYTDGVARMESYPVELSKTIELMISITNYRLNNKYEPYEIPPEYHEVGMFDYMEYGFIAGVISYRILAMLLFFVYYRYGEYN